MLSRDADSCFWIGRYVERAEATARAIDVHYHAALETTFPFANDKDSEELSPMQWHSILAISGSAADYERRYGTENDRDVLHGPVAQENFAPERLLLLEEGHCLRDQALDVCGTGSRRLVNFGATSLSTLLQLVSNGLGMTLIPEIAVDVERQRNAMRIVRFDDPQPSRTIGMIWRKSSATKADIKTLGELIRRVHVQPIID